MQSSSRLVIVSNRLPCQLSYEDEQWLAKPSAGGLVTALSPVLKKTGGVWIGWNGLRKSESAQVPEINQLMPELDFDLSAVKLAKEDFDKFYNGFSNQIIWPLFHSQLERCHFEPTFWDAYLKVNKIFADKVLELYQADDFVWVHDYHLIELGVHLRKANVENSLGFFLHIPFPPPEIFFALPWRKTLIQAMLAYDKIGLQTSKDMRNFLRSVKSLFPHVAVEQQGGCFVLRPEPGRRLTVGRYPISIDYGDFSKRAKSKKVINIGHQIHADFVDRKVIFGIERLDYTKGIPNKLQAFRYLLEQYPEWRGKVCLLQVVVPSRENIAEYQEIKQDIERQVSEINGEFSHSGWVPIHYRYQSLQQDVLLAYYRASDIALVTPLNDGMNLVAKEYCTCQADDRGVLILSEFAGAAAQLGEHALLVNPYDIRGVAKAMNQALTMPTQDAKARMSALRNLIKENDIYKWADDFLKIS